MMKRNELRVLVREMDERVDEAVCFVLTCASMSFVLLSALFVSERIFGWALAVMSLCCAYLLLSVTERNAALCAAVEGMACVIFLILFTPVRIYFCGLYTLPKFYRLCWSLFLRLQKARNREGGEDSFRKGETVPRGFLKNEADAASRDEAA